MDGSNRTDKPFESNEVSEEKLEEVSGGSNHRGNKCFFEPALPYLTRWYGDDCYVICKNYCGVLNVCSCMGTVRCIDRYHKVQYPPDGMGTHVFPFPEMEYNHNDPTKKVAENPWVNRWK